MTLERVIDVQVPAARAFAVWTEHVGLWWPPRHSITGEPGARMSFEPGVGGRLLERAPSGEEVSWGRIRVREPPGRLVYSFLPGGGPDASEVEVCFQPRGTSGTRVVVHHRPGEMSAERWSGFVLRFERGWAALIPALTQHLESNP